MAPLGSDLGRPARERALLGGLRTRVVHQRRLRPARSARGAAAPPHRVCRGSYDRRPHRCCRRRIKSRTGGDHAHGRRCLLSHHRSRTGARALGRPGIRTVENQPGRSRRPHPGYVLENDDGDRRFADSVAQTGHWTRRGVVYDVPYRCLTTPAVSNLLTAGRCISTSRYVHQATKEIPAAVATGEAAGAAAGAIVGGGPPGPAERSG